MKQDCKKIAFYGKGGIGKSTVAANVSAVLALMGKRVLHIGCDPKSDSTRTLMGRRIPTVLDALRSEEFLTVDDVLFAGYSGVTCVEAGGPEAGTGCAGKAITVMAGQLEELGVFDEDWDAVIYDVLGDVVCGGFSIPMRERFADVVYVVTSAEFMPLYAANNIIRGIARIQELSGVRFGGLIYNQRGVENGTDRAGRFAQAVNVSLTASISHSAEIEEAEFQGKTAIELFPEGIAAKEFGRLALTILQDSPASTPRALSDQQMDEFCRQSWDRGHGRG